MIFTAVLLFILLILFITFFFYYFFTFKDAPYVPSRNRDVLAMVDLAKVKMGEKAVDIGSGDGRIVIALAKAGAVAHGYEINPFLVILSFILIRKAGVQKNAFIHWQSIWKTNFSNFTLVTVYCLPKTMQKLEEKLQKELPKGARLLSNTFSFDNWQKVGQNEKIALYNKL